MGKPNIIGIIPARGGSKGVPKKNIRTVGGYPMIAYSIIAGQLVENIDRCIISTDSQEIADIAKTLASYGCAVAINYFKNPEKAETVVASIKEAGG